MKRRRLLRLAGGAAALAAHPMASASKENQVKKLEDLRAVPIQDDNLHLACIKGALDFLGMDVSAAWLAGATGHAFIIHIEEGVCLSSVWSAMADSYRTGEMTRLGRNVGYELDYHQVDGGEDGLPGRRQSWADVRQAIDAGHPCYMYHNFCYQMIGGYDDDGIHFADDSFPWSNAGQGPVSVLEHGGFDMGIVRPGEPAPDSETVKAGLRFALSHPGPSPRCRGLAAYDRWIETIESGEAGGTCEAFGPGTPAGRSPPSSSPKPGSASEQELVASSTRRPSTISSRLEASNRSRRSAPPETLTSPTRPPGLKPLTICAPPRLQR